MSSALLDYIKSSFDPYVGVLAKSNEVDHAYVTGSIARGIYYPGWSDVDIVFVFCKRPSEEVLAHLTTWQQALTQHFQCKIGIDYFALETLIASTKNTQLLAANFGSMQNYFAINRDNLASGLLFGDLDRIPSVPMDQLKEIDVTNNLCLLEQKVYETVIRSPKTGLGPTEFRTLVKSTLYAEQALLLRDSGQFITDYQELTARIEQLYRIDNSTLKRVLSQLATDTTNLLDVANIDTSGILDCFAQTMRSAGLA